MPDEEPSTCKVVDLINVDPIRANGNGGIMITYWHTGKPELPLVFKSEDAQQLIERILKCLAFQQDERSQSIIENYFT